MTEAPETPRANRRTRPLDKSATKFSPEAKIGKAAGATEVSLAHRAQRLMKRVE